MKLDNFIPVIESDLVHTTELPFCLDASCACHEDQELIGQVSQQVQNGLLTPEEANYLVAGKTL